MPRISVSNVIAQEAKILSAIRLSGDRGIREIDISHQTEIHRRTVNNYLRPLSDDGVIEKRGRKWFFLKTV